MDADFIEEFVLDMEDLLEKLESSLIHLEKDKENKDILNELFRVMHSAKGIAAMMELQTMESLTHNLENLLFEVRDGKMEMSEEIINLLLLSKDYLGNFLENLKINRTTEEEGTFIDETIKKINSMTKKTGRKKKSKPTENKNIIINSTILENLKSNEKIYKIKIVIKNNCTMKKIRAYMILKECMQSFYIFSERPSISELEDENTVFNQNDIYFSLISEKNQEEIIVELQKIGEVESVLIEEILNFKENNLYVFNVELESKLKVKFSPLEFKNEFEQEIKIQNKEIENIVSKNINSLENLNMICRSFHTIAGLGKILNRTDITSLSDESIKYIEVIKPEINNYNENDIKSLILNSTQIIKSIIDLTENGIAENLTFKTEYHLNMLELAIAKKELLNDETFKIFIKDIDNVSDIEIDKLIKLKLATEEKKEEIVSDELKNIKKDIKEEDRLPQGEIRVGIVKIEKLNELISELQMIHSIIEEKSKIISSELNSDISKMIKIAKDIQNITVSMNNLTLQNLFHKMSRVFRDALKKTGKKAELITTGEDIEIERVVLEKISEPMMHIIKNCLSHGIEESIERVKNGKDEYGTIRIDGYLKNNSICIEVSDDGRGVNIEAVFKKATEKGIAVKKIDEYSKKDIINFLFFPGFSTAEKIDEMAGRGVGMDVVKSEIEKLNGFIDVESEQEKGTKIVLKIPVNSMVINGMVVEINEKKYIIPTQYIKEISDNESVQNIEVKGEDKFIKLRKNIIEYADMSFISGENIKNRKVLIISETNGIKKVIGVDKIIERRDVTVTRLNIDINERIPFTGAAILGNGRVYLILDVEYILNLNKKTLKEAIL